jgi:hypothetical protein
VPVRYSVRMCLAKSITPFSSSHLTSIRSVNRTHVLRVVRSAGIRSSGEWPGRCWGRRASGGTAVTVARGREHPNAWCVEYDVALRPRRRPS